jgi:hypothetical protein
MHRVAALLAKRERRLGDVVHPVVADRTVVLLARHALLGGARRRCFGRGWSLGFAGGARVCFAEAWVGYGVGG